jgi:hypothetical protein
MDELIKGTAVLSVNQSSEPTSPFSSHLANMIYGTLGAKCLTMMSPNPRTIRPTTRQEGLYSAHGEV